MELRVFLVEDLQGMRRLIQDLFASIGGLRLVGSAGTEAEANLWLDDHQGEWDVALIDLVLDQGSGLSVISRAKGSPQPGQVAVFSSYASNAIRERCLALGADAVFDKSETVAFIQWLDEQTRGSQPSP
jgi:DNA-binding NarL/FixJ family response regulator